jgi:outer membrane protein assembly factor BamB
MPSRRTVLRAGTGGARTPVQFGEVCLTAVDADEAAESPAPTLLLGGDVQTGAERFARPIDASLWHVAAGADCAVFGGSVDEFRAYRPDGDERWRVETASRVTDLAVLDEQVLAARRDGHVVALA